MDFATAVDRVRDDYNEMPGLELTLPQAVRLMNMGPEDCRYAIDALVDIGFLKWTARRTIVRTGQELRPDNAPRSGEVEADAAYAPVRSASLRDKSVGL